MAESPDDVSFTIESRLLEELGENLITRNHVAVAELIKNSYDADATEVTIEFRDARKDDTEEGSIRIKDDGTGMSFTDIRDKFMRIATTDKIRNPKTEKYGREKAGDKGIGRFACRRLANVLDITTVSYLEEEEVYEQTSLTIDWKRYEYDQQIEEVEFEPEVQRYPKEKDLETGVTLDLKNLQDSWTQRDFNTLRRNVLTLSVAGSRRRAGDYEEDPGFEIKFDAPEFEKGEGTLSEQIHDAGWGCLEGKITDDGQVDLNLEAKLIGEQSYKFSSGIEGLANTDFKISYIPHQRKHFRDTQTLTLQQASEIKDNHGGIRVYKGGFRVFSYGGPENDWLGIDEYAAARRTRPDEQFDELSNNISFHSSYERAMLVHPDNKQLVGRVMISSDADLTMQSNREGFIDQELFEDLKDIIKLSLQWLTLQYSHYKSVRSQKKLEEEAEKFEEKLDENGSDTDDSDENSTNSGGSDSSEGGSDSSEGGSDSSEGGSDSSESDGTGGSSGKNGSSTESQSPAERETTEAALNLLEEVADTATETVPEGEREVSDEAVGSAIEVIRTSLKQKEQQIDFFQSAFSVNQVVFSFSHELRGMVNSLGTNAAQIESIIGELPKEHEERFEDITTNLRGMQERFEEQMDLFGIFMEGDNQKKKEQVVVSDVVETVESATTYIADEYDVSIETSVSDILLTPPMYESELYSIILNLVTNSIKAIGSTSDTDGRILISGDSTEDGIRLRVYDNGVGLSKDAQEDVFQPLISDPEDEMYSELEKNMPDELSEELGKGTGLGLSIVQNIAEKYNGEAQFIDDDEWTTCVEVTING